MVAAAASTTTTTTDHSNPKESTTNHCQRPPLLPSERDNGVGVGVSTRRPKSKEVTSRYLSSSSSISSSYSSSSTNSSSSNNSSFRRLPSPSPSRVVPATPTPLKRSQSVERRRPGTPGVVTGTPVPDWRARIGTPHLSTAAKVLSSRSLSVSFQGESYSLPISKTKAVAPTPQQSNVRKGTPERRRVSPMPTPLRGGGDHMENSKPVDQHRWPGSRPRQVNLLSKSLDCSVEKGSKVVGSGKVVRSLLQQSMIDDSRRASFDGRLNPDLSNAELIQSIQVAVDADTTANGSDSDSRSSGSNECGNGGITRGRSTPRGSISVSARFWQETNSRMRGLMEPRSPMSNTTSSRSIAQPKLIPKKSFGDTALSSPRNVSISRTLSSPLRGPVRPASPSKSMPSSASSPSRGNASPSRVRNGMATPVGGSQLCNTPSVLCFPADILRRKVEDNRVVDAHLLRLFYNRNLQWCFVNARADAAMLTQRLTAEMYIFISRDDHRVPYGQEIKDNGYMHWVCGMDNELSW
ncbi:hypothetical protein GIB67_020182 [Kingdonia uniflora]|uniref:Uncharacterized protein n=1 Tax=Kingdonia uniflora TaxID=39325 RepID=A0A7J7NU83_9MAGN|nr:hypothetical protein GIB67_020182 [Kingdonia uniflora]